MLKGDNVKVDNGHRAICTDQRGPASSVAAARFTLWLGVYAGAHVGSTKIIAIAYRTMRWHRVSPGGVVLDRRSNTAHPKDGTKEKVMPRVECANGVVYHGVGSNCTLQWATWFHMDLALTRESVLS